MFGETVWTLYLLLPSPRTYLPESWQVSGRDWPGSAWLGREWQDENPRVPEWRGLDRRGCGRDRSG